MVNVNVESLVNAKYNLYKKYLELYLLGTCDVTQCKENYGLYALTENY